MFQERAERAREITKRVWAEMPLPDPSIVYGPDAEMLGVKTPEPEARFGRLPHNAIEPFEIKSALFYVQPKTATIVEEGPGVRKYILHDEPLPLDEADQAKQDKLTEMLRLSEEYLAELHRREIALGMDSGDEADNIVDALCDRQNMIERAIRTRPAQTAEGLLAKIDLYEADPEQFVPGRGGGLIGSILRDTWRLLSVA
jgi:hypothetical protein